MDSLNLSFFLYSDVAASPGCITCWLPCRLCIDLHAFQWYPAPEAAFHMCFCIWSRMQSPFEIILHSCCYMSNKTSHSFLSSIYIQFFSAAAQLLQNIRLGLFFLHLQIGKNLYPLPDNPIWKRQPFYMQQFLQFCIRYCRCSTVGIAARIILVQPQQLQLINAKRFIL